MTTNIVNQQSPKNIKNQNVLKMPRETNEEILDFFLTKFKRQPCKFKKGACPDKATCEGWHHESERRRNPFNGSGFLYSDEPCPKLKVTGKWLRPSNCDNGDRCPFAHTMLEQMYHPNIYKTSLCTNFASSNGDQCQWGYYCTHSHGEEDIRNPTKKNISQSNVGETPDSRSLEKTQEGIIVVVNTTNDMNGNLSSSNQQASVSQHSASNVSSAHSQNTSYLEATISSNEMNTPPNFKCSPLPPTGPPMTQPIKPPHLVLPTASCFQPQHPTYSKTPNIVTNESAVYSCTSQTFPNRLFEKQQYQQQNQYTWGITLNNTNPNVNNINNNMNMNMNINMNNNNAIITNMNANPNNNNNNNNNNNILYHVSNSQHTPPPPMSGTKSYDAYHTNTSPNHSPVSFSYGAQTFTPTTSTGTNSPTIKPNPKSSTLQVATAPLTQISCNQFANNMASSSTATTSSSSSFNNGLKNDVPQVILQQQLQQPQQLQIQTQENVAFSERQTTSAPQSSQALQANDDVSYYLFGDDLSSNGIKVPINSMFEKQNTEIMLLREQINQLQSQLKLERERNQMLMEAYQDHDMINIKNEIARMQHMQWLEKYMICLNCHSQKSLQDNVLVPCGHLVCSNCVPQRGQHCPICKQIISQHIQKLAL